MSYHVLRGLGEGGCPPCAIQVSGQCMPCPDGTDFPECQGCIDGMPPPKSSWTDSIWGAVAIGVVTTLAVTVASTWVLKRVN